MKGQNPWYWLFLMAALEAGAAIAIMLMVPREGGSISLARGTVLTFGRRCHRMSVYGQAEREIQAIRLGTARAYWR
jgi:hypothetical protein